MSSVRVHHDAQAAASAQAMGARAYTVGSHIAFARGRYAPDSSAGRDLLAHELTHVAQQANAGLGADVQRADQIALVPADHPSERAADAAARGGRAARTPPPTSAPAVLQRAPDDVPKPDPKPFIAIDPPLDLTVDIVVQLDDPRVPELLRRPMKLSELEKALDVLGVRSGKPVSTLCESYGNGFFTDRSTDAFKGQCCQGLMHDENHCCPPKRIGIGEGFQFRCARPGEVRLPDGHIVRPTPVPTPPTVITKPDPAPSPPPGPSPAPSPAPAVAPTHTIVDHFSVDGRTAPAAAAGTLDALAARLIAAGDVDIHVDGHTDSTYTVAYNQTLSEARAKDVKAKLAARGVPAARMIVTGYGEQQPLAAEKTDEDRARNRRVDVWFIPAPARP